MAKRDYYDVLGLDRPGTDRLRNIAEIGVRTYGWTFANRGQPVPGEAPHVVLLAPSGASWTWNPPSESNRVQGSALEFCQVVTQVRNIADTRLAVVGGPATTWMARRLLRGKAQARRCPPEQLRTRWQPLA